jgi:hypothetical protein
VVESIKGNKLFRPLEKEIRILGSEFAVLAEFLSFTGPPSILWMCLSLCGACVPSWG